MGELIAKIDSSPFLMTVVAGLLVVFIPTFFAMLHRMIKNNLKINDLEERIDELENSNKKLIDDIVLKSDFKYFLDEFKKDIKQTISNYEKKLERTEDKIEKKLSDILNKIEAKA